MPKRLLVLISGWTFIVLGILGLFLPILQGILFLCIGLAILSTEYAWAHNLLQRAKARFPSVARVFDHAMERAHALRTRWTRHKD